MRRRCSGAFWAALTHPRCDEALQEVLLRDMHMLQHQAGAAVRVESAPVPGLEQRKRGADPGARARSRALHAGDQQKSTEIEQLHAELVHVRASDIGQATPIRFLQQDIEQLKNAQPAHDQIAKLQKKLALLTEHQHQLQTQNAELRHALAQAERSVRQQALEALQPAPAAAEPVPEPALQLHAKEVVCVGDRHTNVANYRAVIEQAGGQLPTTMAALTISTAPWMPCWRRPIW